MSPSCFIGMSQNMVLKLKAAKKLLIFLGKSVLALVEAVVFAIIPKPRKNVAGEIVLITGAGSGLGRLLALKFAQLGSVLVLWDISQESNEETCKMAVEAGATRVYAYTCDCSRKVVEILKVAQQIIEANRKASPNAAFGVYLAIFILYYLACRPLSLAAKKLEKHWR